MPLSDQEKARLEEAMRQIIMEWYSHIDEYPHLHKYIAASLIQTGIVDAEATKRLASAL